MTTPLPGTSSTADTNDMTAEPSAGAPTAITNLCTPPSITCTCPTDDMEDLQRQLQLKNNELVGIAVGLLFVGILIGTLFSVLVVCVYRCVCVRGGYKFGKGVKYQKQTDEVAFAT